MNQTAIAFWGFCTCLGYLIGGARGAVTGLAFALGVSLFAGIRRR